MCGIAGFWTRKAVDDDPVELLLRMGSTLAYRGPDDSGKFYDEPVGLGLCFRRLSIIDLSAEGHQPMSSSSGRFTIIFNGEIYNFEQLREELGPHAWRGHSDTEVMLEAIERWGLEPAVKRFVGMFAFALWDRQQRHLHLVRDRLGIKPLYYGYVDGNFVFASELKAIREFPGFAASIDREALTQFMRFAYVPSPHCIYQGFHKVQPGHILTVTSAEGPPTVSSFWSAAQIAHAGLQSRVQIADDEIVEQLHQELLQAVRLRMIADVPLGAFLSGGIDSSLVVALMQAQSSRPVKTFTIGFHEDRYNEAAHARKIAEHLGTEHTELYLTAQDALNVVPLLPAMYDEPFADSSQIPTHLVSKLARQDVTVALSGDGGDELFGGYTRYLFFQKLWKYLGKVPDPLARSGAKLIRAFAPETIDRFIGATPLLPAGIKRAPGERFHKLAQLLSANDRASTYLHCISHWTDPALVVADSRDPNTVLQSIQDLEWLPETQEVGMLTDLINYLPDDILTKVDRASMAVSLEARVPLLDHRLVEFSLRLPFHCKVRDGQTKWLLRQVLYRYVPPELIDRPKMGFAVPIDLWLRGPLREWAEDLLAPRSLARHGWLNPAPIRKKWEEHVNGRHNWDYQLWNVLMFQDWYASTASHWREVPVWAGN